MHTDTNVTCMLLCGVFTVPSNGQQWSFDDCLEIRRENKQELFCAVLYTTVVYNDVHTHMRTATIRYDTIRYIYGRSKPDRRAISI